MTDEKTKKLWKAKEIDSNNRILPQYEIEKQLNKTGMKSGGSANSLIVERVLCEFYNEVEKEPNRNIRAWDLKDNINCGVKAIIVRTLSDFGKAQVNEFDLSTKHLLEEFKRYREDSSDRFVRLIIADRISECMRKFCINQNIEIIQFKPLLQQYKLYWLRNQWSK